MHALYTFLYRPDYSYLERLLCARNCMSIRSRQGCSRRVSARQYTAMLECSNLLQVAKFLDAGMKRLQTVDPDEGSNI